jgi:hypothetical protein
MSQEAVQRVLSRAVIDADFREALKTHPDDVFANEDVTPEEQQVLKSTDWDSIGSNGVELEPRVSRMSPVHEDLRGRGR